MKRTMLLVITFLMTSLSVHAFGGGHRKGMKMLEELNLSNEQVEKFKAFRELKKSKRSEHKKRKEGKKAKMKELFLSNNLTVEQLQEVAKDRKGSFSDPEVAKAFVEFHKTLSSEQKTKFSEMMEKRKKRRKRKFD